MNNKFLNIFIIILLIIIAFLGGMYFCDNLFIKDTTNKNDVDIYSKKLEVNFDVKDTFVDNNTIIIDEDAYENIIITSNKEYNLKLYSVKNDSANFEKDELLKEKYITESGINIKTLMGEVMPRLYIEIVSEDEILKVVPLYNGRDGGYIFKRLD